MKTPLQLFDEEITNLVDRGQNRPAIEYSLHYAAHAVAAAAGVYFSRLADSDTALKLFKLALEIEPKNPKLYNNLVCLLCQNFSYEEAYVNGKIGISLDDAPADMFYNHGIACKSLGKLVEAADAFRHACRLNPSNGMAHCQLANVLLPLGIYEEGLREDEWRTKALPALKAIRRRYKQPDWDGKADLTGKKVLIYNEQGHGDAIQFSRYIPKLKELGAYVIFEAKPEIHNLFIDNRHVDELLRYEKKNPIFPEHDYVMSVGSLPYFFDANLDKIPMDFPYLWHVKSNMPGVDALISGNFKVGIVWAGSFYHTSDSTRSCFLRHFETLNKVSDVTLYSLQQGNMTRAWKDDVVDLLEGSNVKYVDLAFHLKDFNDTALVLQKLNLLISVDTSAAHLAGALGLPVWLLLPYAHEWRWRKKWYPTMRIFKQPSPGDWKGLLEDVAIELQNTCNNHCKKCILDTDQ